MIYLVSYLFGSILFGVIAGKFLKIGDLRNKGSGNIGATNIARVSGSKKIGILVAILDGLKGVIPVIFARYLKLDEEVIAIVGMASVLGHIFPIWHKFQGGKGVATFLGVNIALNWQIGLVLAFIWLITFLMTKISSLASLVTVVMSTICYFFNIEQLIPVAISSIIIIFKHKENIKRLIDGKEVKIKI